MNRGAVVIGIDKYTEGNLHSLQAAVKGAKAFAACAQGSGFEVTLLTDEAGPVGIADLRRAITAFTKRTGDDALQQLVVYFAGHGINKGYSEYWLLSEAPLVTSEAVNLRSTIDRARYDTGIPHVVFVSDACRTAADSISAQEVVGDVPLLNEGRDVEPAEIDRFFGATVGRPAQEVRVVEDAVASYTALYTECLIDALSGKFPDVFEEAFENGVGYITSRKLKEFLPGEMTRRAAALRLKRAQDPDTQVESDYPPKFLVQRAVQLQPGPVMRGGLPSSISAPSPREVPVPTLSTVAGDRLDAAMAGRPLAAAQPPRPVMRGMARSLPQDEVLSQLEADERAIMESRSRGHFESECGFSITGARFATADALNTVCEVIDNEESVRVNFSDTASPRSIILRLDDGRGAVLAALPGYIGVLTVDEDELVNVAYEPAENNWRHQDFVDQAERLRTLRAVVAAATRNGVFSVDRATAERLGDSIRVLKGIDPTLGLYAAYAYADIGMLDKVRSVAGFMRDDVSADLFDAAMLARDGRQPPAELPLMTTAPFCPMLSQGWALLQAKQVQLPEPVLQASKRLLPSLWTLFAPDTVEPLRQALYTGAIR